MRHNHIPILLKKVKKVHKKGKTNTETCHFSNSVQTNSLEKLFESFFSSQLEERKVTTPKNISLGKLKLKLELISKKIHTK